MANPNPVIPPNFGKTFTPEERRRNSAKGGRKSQEVQREKRSARETLSILMDMSLKKGKIHDIENVKSFELLKGKNLTPMELSMIKLVQSSIKGDINATKLILDIMGEKPAQKLEVTAEVNNPFEGLTTEELRKLVGSDD